MKLPALLLVVASIAPPLHAAPDDPVSDYLNPRLRAQGLVVQAVTTGGSQAEKGWTLIRIGDRQGVPLYKVRVKSFCDTAEAAAQLPDPGMEFLGGGKENLPGLGDQSAAFDDAILTRSGHVVFRVSGAQPAALSSPAFRHLAAEVLAYARTLPAPIAAPSLRAVPPKVGGHPLFRLDLTRRALLDNLATYRRTTDPQERRSIEIRMDLLCSTLLATLGQEVTALGRWPSQSRDCSAVEKTFIKAFRAAAMPAPIEALRADASLDPEMRFQIIATLIAALLPSDDQLAHYTGEFQAEFRRVTNFYLDRHDPARALKRRLLSDNTST